MSIKFVAGQRVPMTAEEIADQQEREAAELARQAAEAAALAAKLAKRPLRSQINAVKNGVANAGSVTDLRAQISTLLVLLENVLEIQEVPVVEDVE